MNELIFLKLTARYLKYELYNFLNYHIQNDFMRFNSVYKKLEQKLIKIKILQNMSRN